MNEKQISETLFNRLESLGIIKWHKNKDHSFYLKFRDVRLGSVRISNHRGRERYHYTYEIYKSDKDIERKIEDIVESIKVKASKLGKFNPESWIVWDNKLKRYTQVNNFNEYKEKIYGRQNIQSNIRSARTSLQD